MLNTTASWNVGRASGRCAACAAELPPNTPCWAALCDGQGIPTRHEKPDPAAKPKKEEPLPSPFIRIDFCESCWAAGRRPDQLTSASFESLGLSAAPAARLFMFSYWKTTVPVPQQKKKLLVDDSVLMDVFARMEGKTEPQEIRFRFVLALILMRKRLLKYEGMESPPPPPQSGAQPAAAAAPETWRMLPKIMGDADTTTGGWAQPVHVINPHLTAEQITEVSQQLSAILAEEV